MTEVCFICGTKVQETIEAIKDDTLYRYLCPRCGSYSVRDSNIGHFLHIDFTDRQRANASGWLRENPNTELTEDDVSFLKALATPGVGKRATKLLDWYARVHPIPGTQFRAGRSGPEAVSRAWALNEDEVWYLIESYLMDGLEFITPPLPRVVIGGGYDTRISPKGWAHLESLQRGNPESANAFIAMWFDDSMKHLRTALTEAVATAGYNPVLIDERQHENDVNAEIIAAIRQSKFVVADFTGHRGGVYLEAGFAQGMGLKVIRTCRKSDKKDLHFDVDHYRFAFWEAEALDKLKRDLESRIIAAVGTGPKRPST